VRADASKSGGRERIVSGASSAPASSTARNMSAASKASRGRSSGSSASRVDSTSSSARGRRSRDRSSVAAVAAPRSDSRVRRAAHRSSLRRRAPRASRDRCGCRRCRVRESSGATYPGERRRLAISPVAVQPVAVLELGHAEVGEADVVVAISARRDEHVGGLEVAVDDPHLVGTRERERELQACVRCALPPERAAPEHTRQRLARDVVHDEVGRLGRLAVVGDLDDVRDG
jgi:hypothetical protein